MCNNTALIWQQYIFTDCFMEFFQARVSNGLDGYSEYRRYPYFDASRQYIAVGEGAFARRFYYPDILSIAIFQDMIDNDFYKM